MKKIYVNSTAIDAIGWSRNTGTPQTDYVQFGTLRVWFLTGKVYDYQDVSNFTFQGIKDALSKGKAYNRVIKGNYACVRRIQRRSVIDTSKLRKALIAQKSRRLFKVRYA